MGAWIEISDGKPSANRSKVAPLVGAWIEMPVNPIASKEKPSLPLWERGLKSKMTSLNLRRSAVAPLVGAWIEMRRISDDQRQWGRSPCGSVD